MIAEERQDFAPRNSWRKRWFEILRVYEIIL